MRQRTPRAIVFDLYGTLLRTESPVIHKELPRLLGVPGKTWMALVRRHLMITAFPDRAAFVRFILDSVSPEQPPGIQKRAASLVDREIESIRPLDGVHSMLTFLKRRGFVLGLMSNLSSIHKEPLARYDLEPFFEATAFSCDEGLMKPEPAFYLDLCARLGVEPQDVLAVGDSARNDVRAPRALGMQAVLIAGTPGSHTIRQVSELGWLNLGGDLKPIVGTGSSIRLASGSGTLQDVTPLPDAGHGRLNLVATARVEQERGVEVFCKRFLFPPAAYVEELMHRLLNRLGMATCDIYLHPGPEPVLVASKAPGKKFDGCSSPALAFEIGRHCAVSYIFANADLRPRNTFVSYEGSHPVVTVIDLEHSLFNLALDVRGLDEPERPGTFDRMSADEVQRRLKRRVLNERTTRRAMRTFLKIDSLEDERAVAFRSGWVTAFRHIRAEGSQLCRLIDERVHTEPFLVIGTRAYRRAMAKIDVADIETRMKQDPEELFPRLSAVKGRRAVGRT